MKLSIVIPAFNEEKRLPGTLRKILRYCTEKHIDAEVLVVDDGSTDGTIRCAEKIKDTRIRVIKSTPNRGKGYAVRLGIEAVRHPLILVSDSDLATPITELDSLLAWRRLGYDIVIGSRNLDRSKVYEPQPMLRHLMGRLFPSFVSVLVMRGFTDTQCGFKLLGNDAAHRVVEQMRLERFCYDVELLFLAKRAGYSIKEVAVEWHDMQGSKVRPVADSISMIVDLFRIRWYQLTGAY